jgi:O-antigen/teichoic acid export membrane protein
MIKRPKEAAYRLLRRSEKYTRTDMVYLAQGGFWQTFGQVGTALLSFALVLAFANLLPKETYGTYKYILSLAAIFNIFILTGMNQAVSQAVATGFEGALRASIKYQLRWNSFATLAFWIAAGYYLYNGNAQLGLSLFILGLFWPLTATFNTYSAYLAGKKEFRLNNLFSLLATAVYVAGTVLAIYMSGEVIWLIAAYAITTFAANLLLYWLTLRRFRPPATEAEGALRYGRHLTFINLTTTVVSQLDSVILHHFWGPAQLATYSIAMAIPNRAIPFFKSSIEVGFPKLATKTPHEINQVFYRRIAYGLGAGVIVAALYILAAPYLFLYLLPQYLDAVLYTQILATGFVFAIPNRYLGLLFAAQKMSRAIFAATLAQNVIRVALYLILGVWLGILGLVIAQAISSFVSMILNIGCWRLRKIPPLDAGSPTNADRLIR